MSVQLEGKQQISEAEKAGRPPLRCFRQLNFITGEEGERLKRAFHLDDCDCELMSVLMGEFH